MQAVDRNSARGNRLGALARGLLAGVGAFALAGLAASSAAASETRGYVVNWFYPAIHFSDEACPGGPAPISEVFYHRLLKEMGYSPKEIDEQLKGFPNEGKYRDTTAMRGRDANGNPVNVFAHPESTTDPKMKEAVGKYNLGFNLNGKVEDNGFTDPETGEQGVDNQFFRVVGCIQSHRAPPGQRPTYLMAIWDILRDQPPAYLIEVSGIDDPMNDDDVQVGIYRALERANRDSSGDIRGDNTYRVDGDPRSTNQVHGKIKDGVLWTDQAPSIHLVGDPFGLAVYNFQQARLRLDLKNERAQKGIIGGYHEWKPIYWHYGSAGWVVEHSSGIEIPGVYYGLKKYADANPDPKTGENTAISISYIVETVPAFIVHPENKVSDAGKPGDKQTAQRNN